MQKAVAVTFTLALLILPPDTVRAEDAPDSSQAGNVLQSILTGAPPSPPDANKPDNSAASTPAPAPEVPDVISKITGAQPDSKNLVPAMKAEPVILNLHLGDAYHGGIVFWVDKSSHNQHGLIAALSDQAGTYQWQAASNSCMGSVIQGSTGWRLPSLEEAILLFNQQDATARAARNNHVSTYTFDSAGRYWSATEYEGEVAWSYDFQAGKESINPENNPLYVHCIMSF